MTVVRANREEGKRERDRYREGEKLNEETTGNTERYKIDS